MGQRLNLHHILVEITPNVYFQPPPDTQMVYPCIVYQRDYGNTKFAGNSPYSFTQRYQVTLIDRNPDTEILVKIAALPMCLYDRGFQTSGLNHDVFILYY